MMNDYHDMIYEQLMPKVQYTFTIYKALDKCPLFVDIYLTCLQYTNKGLRKENCQLHHDTLQQCIESELRMDIKRFAHHECKRKRDSLTRKEISKRTTAAASSATEDDQIGTSPAMESLAQCIRDHVRIRDQF